MFDTREVALLRAASGAFDYKFDQCRFGLELKKTNTVGHPGVNARTVIAL